MGDAMKEYHKIQTVFKRDERGKIIVGEYSLPEFQYLASNKWTFTEKVDGTNIRVIWQDRAIRFGGKTDNAQMPTFLYDRLVQLFTPERMLTAFDCDACLYGEGFGAKIQKGGGNYIQNGVDFVLFDVRVGDWWLKREDVQEIATKLGITTVPLVGFGTLYEMVNKAEAGFNSMWGDFKAEGIVARPCVELRARNGERIITKIKHKDFK
jgi:ATP-dependent RNA circularization protein (DNA/RNA ligase family)